MQKLLLSAVILLTSFSLQAQQFYNQTVVGSNGSEQNARVLVLPDESYLLAITTNGGQTGMKDMPSYGGKDCWILRYDANDQLMWQKAFGGSADEFAEQMTLSQDNHVLVLCGSYSGISGNKTVDTVGKSDLWLFKMDFNGNIIWQKGYGTTGYDACRTILVHPDQSIYLGCTFNVADGVFTDTTYGLGDMLLLKLDAQGNKIWDRSYGTTSIDQLEELKLEPYSNKVVVFGNVMEAGTGNMTPTASVTGTNCWVFKIDPDGDITEQTCFGSGTQYGQIEVAYLTDGTCWVMLETQSDIEGDQTLNHFGSIDTWLVHLDANLQIIGQKVYGGSGIDSPRNITYDGNILELEISSLSSISGNKTESSNGASDLWYLQLNAIDGEILFQKSIGGSLQEFTSVSMRKGTDIRFFIESVSPISGNKEVPNFNTNSDIWCVTMSSTLGVNETAKQKFKIGPNPNNGHFTINGQFFQGDLISIVSAEGRVVQTIHINEQTEKQFIDLDLNPGIYLLQMTTAQGNYCEKICLE
jgi:hypothetical protein